LYRARAEAGQSVAGPLSTLGSSHGPVPRQGRSAACSARKLAAPLRVTGPFAAVGTSWSRERPLPLPLGKSRAVRAFDAILRDRAKTMERYCRGCDRMLGVEQFSFKNAQKGILHLRCRSCCRQFARQHYARAKATYLERNRRNNPVQRLAARRFVHQFLLAHPCVQCGETDPIVLEFNHLDPTAKAGNLCDLVHGRKSPSARCCAPTATNATLRLFVPSITSARMQPNGATVRTDCDPRRSCGIRCCFWSTWPGPAALDNGLLRSWPSAMSDARIAIADEQRCRWVSFAPMAGSALNLVWSSATCDPCPHRRRFVGHLPDEVFQPMVLGPGRR
jgi:hypothetical protein